jgi:hypothetical protein
MPGQIRPNKKLMKVAYDILKTNDNARQCNEREISEERQREWLAGSKIAR